MNIKALSELIVPTEKYSLTLITQSSGFSRLIQQNLSQ